MTMLRKLRVKGMATNTWVVQDFFDLALRALSIRVWDYKQMEFNVIHLHI